LALAYLNIGSTLAGYRIYFGKDGETLIILLGGGSKKRQNRDIQQAIDCWVDYRKRKKVK
jgi:putative addiction module killer protein